MHRLSNMFSFVRQAAPMPLAVRAPSFTYGLRICLAAALLSAGSGCSAPASVMLRINGTPDDALVTLNDRYVDKLGRIKKRGIKLKPGEYRLTVEQVGYFPHDELVRVKKDQPKSVNVELQRIPE